MRYTFKESGIVHVLDYKLSNNSKLGLKVPIVGTYHFAEEQVEQVDLTLDKKSCLDCRLSYNAGDGKCYTHKGNQLMGLKSMLRGLNRHTILSRCDAMFDKFIHHLSTNKVQLIRFGVYGEPVLLPFDYVKQMVPHTKFYTGYTHQWHTPEYQKYRAYFMASTHNSIEVDIANDMGWRVFNVGLVDDAINCPASAEAGRKTTCAKCALCSGAEGKGNKNIYIKQH